MVGRMLVVPVDDSIARRTVELPDIHADPADRMILATAAELGCPIVSRDRRFALNENEASAPTTATTKIVPGPPTKSRDHNAKRQPEAAPIKSAK